MAKNIIIFQDYSSSGNKFFGFKIMDQKSSNYYMKVVSLLENKCQKFEIQSQFFDYSVQKFDVIKLTASDIKVLLKLFDVDEDEHGQAVGIFPDALNDAYQLGIIKEDPDEDDEMFQNDGYDQF